MGRSSFPPQNCEKLWILDAEELHRTVLRLCSQVIESVANPKQLLLLGIPTRGVALAQVLAAELQRLLCEPIHQGVLDPTFHRDDLGRVGTRLVQPTNLPVPIDGRTVVLVDDVVFTHPEHRGQAFDMKGQEGEINTVLVEWKGKPISPTLPVIVAFGRYKAHFRSDELEVIA